MSASFFNPEPQRVSNNQAERRTEWRQMEALGLVAGGLAHDLNNHVTIIGHTAELAEMMNDPERHMRAWAQVRALCERARFTIDRIQAFSRRASGLQQKLDLVELMDVSIRLLRASVPSGVSLKGVNEAGSFPVLGNANQVQEIFIHLVHSAASALPASGGAITIKLVPPAASVAEGETGGVRHCCSWFGVEGAAGTPGLWERLRAQGGGGVDSIAAGDIELAERALVLLAAHGAKVRSDGGEGVLGIEWPVCPAGQSGVGSRGLLMTDQPRELAGWHVAVVEDEPRELDLLRDVLHARGAKVSAFGAAGDFLRWAGGGPAPDLLIVDQVLDELSGEVLAERMHALSPETPVLLIGARLQAGAPEWASGRPLRTLPKPFAFADLFAALKALPKRNR